MKSHVIACAALLVATAAPVAAQLKVQPVVGATLTGGGEKLVGVTYTDGTSENIKSGGLIHVFGGFELAPTPTVAFQFNIGYHIDDSNASNGSVRFSRYPLEGIALWNASPSIRLGLGLRKSLSPSISSSGVLRQDVGSADLTSKAGAILQGEYIGGKYSLLLRYVTEEYSFKNAGSVSGNHVGLGFTWRY
jgi:hypothetical protein